MWFTTVVLAASLASCLAQLTPLERLIEEEIYELNKDMVDKHTDVRDFGSFSHSGFVFSFDVSGGRVGNLSTTELIGTPFINQVNIPNGTIYYFDLVLGLSSLRVRLEYKASLLWIFRSSGTLILHNKGNAVRSRGIIKTFNGKTPCEGLLEEVSLNSFGDLDFRFEPAGASKWLLGTSLNIFTPLFRWPVTHIFDHYINNAIKTPEFKSKFSEMTCQKFDY